MKRTSDVIVWAHDRNLVHGGDPKSQCLKTVSEVGELADNINKKRYGAAEDDIGDILVTLIILGEQIGTTLDRCLEIAWHEIKDRKGRLEGGVFIKEGDV